MGDAHLKECLIFLDDVLIFSNTFEEQCVDLKNVFYRISSAWIEIETCKMRIIQSFCKVSR